MSEVREHLVELGVTRGWLAVLRIHKDTGRSFEPMENVINPEQSVGRFAVDPVLVLG